MAARKRVQFKDVDEFGNEIKSAEQGSSQAAQAAQASQVTPQVAVPAHPVVAAMTGAMSRVFGQAVKPNIAPSATPSVTPTPSPSAQSLTSTPASSPPAAPQRHFTRLTSNIKGKVDLKLEPCVAVVSDRNRAGKTAVLDSFRLALTGAHPVGSKLVDLAGLTVQGEPPEAALTSRPAVNGDGFAFEALSAHFHFPAGMKTPAHTLSGGFEQIEPKYLLPLSSIGELLSLGTAKAREELFKRFGVASNSTPTPIGLDESQTSLWNQALNSSYGDAVDRLSAAGTWIRSKKVEASRTLKNLEETRTRLHHASPTTAGEASEGAEKVIEEKLLRIRQFASTIALREQAKAAGERLEAAITRYQALGQLMPDDEWRALMKERYDAWKVSEQEEKLLTANQALARIEKTTRLYSLIHMLRERLTGDGLGGCPVCMNPSVMNGAELANEIAGAVGEQKALEIQARAEVARIEESHRQTASGRTQEQAKWSAQRAQQEQVHASCMREMRQCRDEFMRLRALVESAGGAEEPTENEAELRAQLVRLQAARIHATQVAQTKQQLAETKQIQEDLKAVESELVQALEALILTVKAAAEKAVNDWMPPNFKAVLALEDSEGKSVCRWEVIGSDGRPHQRGAASGAEWAALTIALACAWSDGQPYRYLLLDDTDLSGFSPTNIHLYLKLVAQAVRDGRLTQALVAWSRPNEIPTEGWQVIKV